jgi:hypothetical protein
MADGFAKANKCDETEPEPGSCAAISCGTLDIMKLEQTSFINGNTNPFVPENPLLFILTSVP